MARVRWKRASHSKSHGGCATCRARRVKCDETQPICHRCVKAGRICEGYKPLPRPAGQLRSICPRPLNPISHLSDIEGNALDFFRRVTVFQLPCASVSETPWEKVALDLVYRQPSIAAAASACAGIHRAITDAQDHNQWQLAMQQYNKSLASVSKYIGDLSAETSDDDVLVVLVACLLLFTYEVFSGQDEKASLHLKTGLRIIHERRCPNDNPRTSNDRHIIVVKPHPTSVFDVLLQIFVRLDSDYTLTGHDDPYLYPICDEPLPASFTDPDQAGVHLEVIAAGVYDTFDTLWLHAQSVLDAQTDLEALTLDQCNCLIRASLRTVDLDDSLQKGIEECRESLKAWNSAFADTKQTKENLISHMTTQIYFFCVCFWVDTWRDASPMEVDRFESQFEYFTSLCEKYLELHVAKTPFRSSFTTNQDKTARIDTPPAFSLGTGVVTCLVAIVERCRNSSIRRRCIATLRRINLRGVFDTDYLIAYLESIVEKEEELARFCHLELDLGPDLQACDIPEAARFLEVVMSPSYHASNFEFYKTKRVGIVYVTGGHGVGGKGLQIGETMIKMA
ncbi:hypothetical protein E4T43_07233 [Aureobasidium subglaciale]|nr:hypothetical protein E4T43_07233 [Aureobasidium subglaciale]